MSEADATLGFCAFATMSRHCVSAIVLSTHHSSQKHPGANKYCHCHNKTHDARRHRAPWLDCKSVHMLGPWKEALLALGQMARRLPWRRREAVQNQLREAHIKQRKYKRLHF